MKILHTAAQTLLQHRVAVFITILLITAGCALLLPLTSVNYNIISYLPDTAPSTSALHIVSDEFGTSIPDTQVMIPNLTIPQALLIKEQLKIIDGVESVTWLDDYVEITKPLDFTDQSYVSSTYVNNTALFSIATNDTHGQSAIAEISELVGSDAAIIGTKAATAYSSATISHDLIIILIVGVPLILLILLLTTHSWIEPFLFLTTIGTAVIINMGTNIIYGEISFMTQAVASIIQLAISMDYAIFLLHRFTEYQELGIPVLNAMKSAMISSFTSITASGVTTIAGCLALMLMSLGIGPDMGRVMVKAILISLICVFTLLPALAVILNTLIIKTKHRSFLPEKATMDKIAKRLLKLGIPALIILLLFLVPAIPATSNVSFIYSDTFGDNKTSIGSDTIAVKETFGDASSLILLVPVGNASGEDAVAREIANIPTVSSVTSYITTVGAEIPNQFLDPSVTSLFYSQTFTRMLISVTGGQEDAASLAAIKAIRDIAQRYYPDEWQLAGAHANAYDIKTYSQSDYFIISFLAIIGVLLILIVTFRNLILPVILVLIIESGIWINCAIPFFSGEPLYYIAYLIISSLQLGATIDYAILLTTRYLENRKTMEKKTAMTAALSSASVSILTSATILIIAGLTLLACSSITLLSQEGVLLARGAFLSLAVVLCVLPTLLLWLDHPIQKTTWKPKYRKTQP